MEFKHTSVMPEEAIHYLNCRPGRIYVDCTLGGAGHSRSILERTGPDGILIGLDQDIDAINNAKTALKKYEQRVHLFHRNFTELPQILESLNIEYVDGILMDIGLSQHQLQGSNRGFSFKQDEPLDMRMDIRNPETAADIVNNYSGKELTAIFFKFGEESFSRQIARKIVARRDEKKFETSLDLATVVRSAIPARVVAKQRIDPSTRTFQALRIAVNHELEKLDGFLKNGVDLLAPGGRICVLSFHSLEDRIVKNRFRKMEKPCTCPPDFPACVCKKIPVIHSLTRKPVTPSAEEVEKNPMARSTKLRAAEKI